MKNFLLLILASLFLLQGGCGGGGGGGIGGSNAGAGGGGGGGDGGGGGGVATSASGTAAFGIIKNGTVKIYALNSDGSQGNLLATTSTNGAGVYSQSLGSYSGPIIAYAYGSYVDEATGATVALTESSALRAALPSASGTVALSITGLTELAVRKAGSHLTASAITGANSAISSIFKVDITGVSPVEASASVMGAAGVTPQQRDYTLALAAMSQMATSASGATAGEKLGNLLNSLTQAINGSSLNAATAAAFTQSLHVYLQNHGDINTVVANNGGSPIITVGSQTGVVTITLSTPAGVSAASLTLNLPAGVTVHSQADTSVSNAVVGLTPATANALTLGKFTPASGSTAGSLTIGLVAGTPVSSGAVLIINADVAPGTTVTRESFSITGTTLVDQNNGTVVPGASLAVSGVSVQ